jgi:hypothetical protein
MSFDQPLVRCPFGYRATKTEIIEEEAPGRRIEGTIVRTQGNQCRVIRRDTTQLVALPDDAETNSKIDGIDAVPEIRKVASGVRTSRESSRTGRPAHRLEK